MNGLTTSNSPALDRLSALLDRFQVSARLFHNGELCGVSTFDAQPGRGFFHVLRRGEMVVTHRKSAGVAQRIVAKEPTLFFYPQPLAHKFHNSHAHGADFTCASVHFEGGENHPLVRALPALIVLPLHKVPALESALDLLFVEAEAVHCGHRLIVDRLFEVVLLQLLRWLLDHGEDAHIATGLACGLADPQLARAITAMHEHPHLPWTIELLAAEAAMSRSSFASWFKKTVGVGPGDYLTEWRLTIARKRLHQGHSIKTIAPELGYANASALSRVFAQKVGISPREWLKREVDLG